MKDVFGLHRWTDVIHADYLRCMISNGKRIAKLRYLRMRTNQSFVSDLFAVGSTHATELCKRAGLDPDAKASAKSAPPPPERAAAGKETGWERV